MNKKFFGMILVIFAAYAFSRHQKELSIRIQPNDTPSYKFLDDAKYYLKTLSADPPSSSLQGKEYPILQNDTASLDKTELTLLEDSVIKTQPHAQISSKVENKKAPNVQDKIYNIAYNIMHTTQGQQLIEKLLLSPPYAYDDKKKLKEPNPYHNNSIIDVTIGKGIAAECGDIVEAHYIIRLVSGQEIENTYNSNKPAKFQIGDHNVIKGLEFAVIGMKKEGRRRLVAPPKLAYTDPKLSKGLIAGNEFVTIDVELLDIKPVLKGWEDKIRIFDIYEEKKSRPFLCSNPVTFNYKITTIDEKILYKSANPVTFILGSSSVPPAINKAFIDIRKFSKRSIIMPSSLLYNKKISFLPREAKLPAKEMLIMDIEISN